MLAQCAVSNNGQVLVVFDHAVWLSHGFINCLASDLLLCPFHKKLIRRRCHWFVAKQIILDLVLSCHFAIEQFLKSVYVCRELTWRNPEVSEFSFWRKSTKRKSLVRRIWNVHNNSCLLELRRDIYILYIYQATEYAILLRNYTHMFSPGGKSGDHSYYCDSNLVSH